MVTWRRKLFFIFISLRAVSSQRLAESTLALLLLRGDSCRRDTCVQPATDHPRFLVIGVVDLSGRLVLTLLHSASTPLPSCRGPSWTARFGVAALSQHSLAIVSWTFLDGSIRLRCTKPAPLCHRGLWTTRFDSTDLAVVATTQVDPAALRQHLTVIVVVGLCGRRDPTLLHFASTLRRRLR